MNLQQYKQWLESKSRYPGIIVLFRIGEWYEALGEDAAILARLCKIPLTSFATGDGVLPHAQEIRHRLEDSLSKLLKAGHKVAICEELPPGFDADASKSREYRDISRPGSLEPR